MIQSSRPSIVDRFRSLVAEREEELGVTDDYGVPALSTEEIVQLYEIVLSDLTSNSKPVIGELTMIAGEYRDHSEGIADAICSRIFEVPDEHKLSSLYLLDSIVKNIGRGYVRSFASHLPEMFCETYRQVHPKYCTSLRRLFSTWSAIFPPSVLHKIEAELQFLAPTSQQSSDGNSFRCSGSPRPAHGIHVNPKYLEARSQFENSMIESIRETDPSCINALKTAFNRKRKERDASASPERWSGASLTFHNAQNERLRNAQNEREVSSSLQLYGRKPVIACDQYDADHPEFITPLVGSPNLRPPGNSTRMSSIAGSEKLLSSKTKLTRLPNSPTRTGPARSLSPSGNEFTKEKSPGRVPPLPSRFAYVPSKVSANDGKRENFLNGYQPDDSHQLLRSSWPYNLSSRNNQQGPRALIDAYGNDRGKNTLNERPLKVDINVNGVMNKAVTGRWQNSEEDEYMWEDMSPTLANQRSNDLTPLNFPLGSLNTRNSLEMPSASLSKPDFRRGSWDPHAPPSVVNDSLTTAEEGISILRPGLGSTRGQGSQYATPQYQGSHYSQQLWKTPQHLPQLSHYHNVKTSGHMTPSAGQDTSSLIDKTLDTEAHFQRLSNAMSRMDSSSSVSMTLLPASTVNYSRGRPQSPPKAPLIFPPVTVNASHPRSLLPIFSQSKQINDHAVKMDVHKPPMGQAQFPNQQGGLITLNQQSQRQTAPSWIQVLQSRNAHETFIPSTPAEISSSLITQQPRNHGHNPNINSTATRSVLSNQIFGLPSSVNNHRGPDTSFQVHQGTLHPLPVGSLPKPSQMGTTSQTMGPAASHLPASNVFSGLINSLVAQGLISVTSSPSVQDSVEVEFNPDLLKVRYESAINALYCDLPRKCTSCGLRFKCQEKHSSHMDWHVTKNRVSKNCKQKPSRKWFLSTSVWLSGAEAVGSDAIPGFWSTEADVEEKVEKEIAVPADENQDACALCGEPFDDFYSDEIEEWMYRGAVYLNAPDGSTSMDRSQLGPIVHAKCRSESETLEDFGLDKEGNNKDDNGRKNMRI